MLLRAEEGCLDRQPCSFGFQVVPMELPASISPACRRERQNRQLTLVATGRDCRTAHASYIAPKSGGRTKGVLRVFVVTASTENVRLIVVPKCG